MATVFFVLAIIFIFLFNRKDKLAIEAFLEGAGGFCGVGMIIGIARGIKFNFARRKSFRYNTKLDVNTCGRSTKILFWN